LGEGIILIKIRVNILNIAGFPKGFKKIVVLGITVFLLCNVCSILYPSPSSSVTALHHQRSIVWDVTLQASETGGACDYVVFGEAPDAHDGPPPDSYDVVKPPAPIPPYLRTWLDDNLPSPYDTLWKDYRSYPDTMKVWNLSVQWVPSDYVSPTMVTISWDPALFDDSEYTIVTLCTDVGIPLKNMLVSTNYAFFCPANIPQNFKIMCLLNHPPNVPSNPTPVNQSTGVSINTDLSWTGGDPDGDPVMYDVFFGTSIAPPKVASNQSYLSYNPGTLDYYTVYYWKIVAWDNHSVSSKGPLWHFTTEANTPPMFGAPSPSNGSSGASLSLTWSIPINDPDGDLFSWTIQCSNGQASNATGASNGTKTLSLSSLSYHITYKVWVNATDPTGSGLYTRRWYTFTTKESFPPVFGAPNPSNGSTDNPLSFSWNISISDPEGDSFDWTIQCSNGNASGATGASNGTKTLPLSGLSYSSTYKVWVNATDPYGSGSFTRMWYRFTTITEPNLPPNVPSSPDPGDGATNVNVTADLSWTGGDPDPGDNVTYDVYFGTTSPPTIVIHNQTTTTYDPGTLQYQKTYYWRIVAWDNHGRSTAGPLWTFTTMPNPDTEPPHVEITQPLKKYLYINLFGFILLKIRFFTNAVIGSIDVNAYAHDNQSGVAKVEFYLEGKFKANDTSAPYTWKWSETGYLFPYNLKVIAFDKAGNQQSKEMLVWKVH